MNHKLFILVMDHVQLHVHSAYLPAIPLLVLYYCRLQWVASCVGLPPFLAALLYIFSVHVYYIIVYF